MKINFFVYIVTIIEKYILIVMCRNVSRVLFPVSHGNHRSKIKVANRRCPFAIGFFSRRPIIIPRIFLLI